MFNGLFTDGNCDGGCGGGSNCTWILLIILFLCCCGGKLKTINLSVNPGCLILMMALLCCCGCITVGKGC